VDNGKIFWLLNRHVCKSMRDVVPRVQTCLTYLSLAKRTDHNIAQARALQRWTMEPSCL